MNLYLDSSVLLRVVLHQPKQLERWGSMRGISSAIVQVECLRTLDRFRLIEDLGAEQIARQRDKILAALQELEIVEITRAVLNRASEPLPAVLGTLDAIHLATALLWREEHDEDLALATHDTALGTAARAYGFEVVGL